jgi:hypothetical protein
MRKECKLLSPLTHNTPSNPHCVFASDSVVLDIPPPSLPRVHVSQFDSISATHVLSWQLFTTDVSPHSSIRLSKLSMGRCYRVGAITHSITLPTVSTYMYCYYHPQSKATPTPTWDY